MRIIALLFGLSVFSTQASAQTITAREASAHVGETMTVRGVADEVHTSRKGDTFLDLDGKYPNQAFTGVIYSQDAGIFPDVHSLEGKTVDVSGRVQLYQGKPEIILHSPSQLRAE